LRPSLTLRVIIRVNRVQYCGIVCDGAVFVRPVCSRCGRTPLGDIEGIAGAAPFVCIGCKTIPEAVSSASTRAYAFIDQAERLALMLYHA